MRTYRFEYSHKGGTTGQLAVQAGSQVEALAKVGELARKLGVQVTGEVSSDEYAGS